MRRQHIASQGAHALVAVDAQRRLFHLHGLFQIVLGLTQSAQRRFRLPVHSLCRQEDTVYQRPVDLAHCLCSSYSEYRAIM